MSKVDKNVGENVGRRQTCLGKCKRQKKLVKMLEGDINVGRRQKCSYKLLVKMLEGDKNVGKNCWKKTKMLEEDKKCW